MLLSTILKNTEVHNPLGNKRDKDSSAAVTGDDSLKMPFKDVTKRASRISSLVITFENQMLPPCTMLTTCLELASLSKATANSV